MARRHDSESSDDQSRDRYRDRDRKGGGYSNGGRKGSDSSDLDRNRRDFRRSDGGGRDVRERDGGGRGGGGDRWNGGKRGSGEESDGGERERERERRRGERRGNVGRDRDWDRERRIDDDRDRRRGGGRGSGEERERGEMRGRGDRGERVGDYRDRRSGRGRGSDSESGGEVRRRGELRDETSKGLEETVPVIGRRSGSESDGGERDRRSGRRRGSDSESDGGERDRRIGRRRGSDSESGGEGRKQEERREELRKRLEREEEGREVAVVDRRNGGRRGSDSESGGLERERKGGEMRGEPRKRLEREVAVVDRRKGGGRGSGSESDGKERDRRGRREEIRKRLEEKVLAYDGKRRDEGKSSGHRGSDSESGGEGVDRRRPEREEPKKRLVEEEGRKVPISDGRDRKRGEDRWQGSRGRSDSESPDDEEMDERRGERREREQPRKKLEEKEDGELPIVQDGDRKRGGEQKRGGSPGSDSENSGEKTRRSDRRDGEHPSVKMEVEKEHKKDIVADGKDRKRDERRSRHHRGSESESSDEERDRRRRRRERERRRYRDDSSDSGGRRKRDRRSERKDRSRRDKRDLEDGEVRSKSDRYQKGGPDSKQQGRDTKGDEAPAMPQAQRIDENPAGALATLGRTGGVYIPPFKLARMMKEVEDKSSLEYQRLTWDALRKSINGLVNKVNATNIKNIIPELFSENLIRGRGLFCRSCMKSQMASPGFTDVFAALVAVVNTKFPEVGELILRRIILQLKRAYKRNDKPQLLAAVKFIAHLVNQQVAHELVALELLTILLEEPTDDSVEVAVDFVKECGSILQDLCPKGLHGIFERFRGILHEGEIDKRVQFLIEGLFAIRKAKFQGHPAVRPELDLVEQEDQLTHEVSLDDETDPETSLDIFRQDPNFLENERRYEEVKKSILGEESQDEDGSEAGSDDDEDEDDEDEDEDDEEEQMQIRDATETNLINLRRTIYLTIMSSVDFEEAGHKLLKIKLEPGQEMELCVMLLECCSQERTYLRYYGLLGQRFCMINKVYQENFEKCFVQQYSMIHRLETNKLRNVAKFFAHLVGTDALPWHVLAYIRLTEEDTTSSSRIFIKILFQELSEHLGIRLLNERLNDPAVLDSFESIFPRDNPRNTRFSINFFTSIGLGGITENLREYLKNMPRMIMQQQKPESEDESDSSGSSSSGSESSSSASDSDSSSSDESDSSDDRRRKRRKSDADDDKRRKRRKRN